MGRSDHRRLGKPGQILRRVSLFPTAARPWQSLGRRWPSARDRAGQAGFTLIEVTLTLVIVSLLAVLSLPRSYPATGSASMRIKAFEIAALLRTDRNAALRSGRPVTTTVDFAARQVRSGGSAGAIPIPAAFEIRVSERLADGVRFAPNGTASGGEIYLRQAAGGIIAIRINGLTSTINIDRGGPNDG